MLKYDNSVSSSIDGKPIYGAQVTVLDEQGNPAVLYSDEAGTTLLSQPVLTDQAGYFAFYIGDGRYNIEVMTGAVLISRTNITMVDTLTLKSRALLVPINEDAATLPPAEDRAGMLLGFANDGAPTALLANQFAGPPGAADNTYSSYAAMQASDPTRKSARLVGDTDNPPHPDGPYNNPTQTIGGWVAQGSDGVAYATSIIPAPTRPVNRVLDDFPTLPSLGVTEGNTPAANAAKFAEIMAKARDLAINTANPPRIRVPRGFYRYDTSPNFAAQGLTLDCEPGAQFIHTGSGRAFVVDGGATGGGVAMMKILGGLVVRGNANTTDGVYNRAIHHSTFDMEVQSVSNYALLTEWAVCNEYWFRCSPLFRPAFSPVPVGGMFLSNRGTGEATSRCILYNPILEGINGYGINVNDGIINTFLGGTSESNVGGIFLGPKAVGNIIDGLDLEFNTTADVFCQGSYNTFRDMLSDSFSSFGGFFNTIRGGLFNSITNNGVHNTLEYLSYSTAGGALNDTGTETEYSSLRNATSNTFLPDRRDRSLGRMQIGSLGAGLMMGRADMVDGGSAANVALAIQGAARAYLRSDAGLLLGWNSTGLGFFDKAATPVGKPNVSGAKGGNAALGSLLGALSSLGLIVDSTTA